MGKKIKIVSRDHTLTDLEAPGRYVGDCRAILDVFPGDKKPYVVTVSVWDYWYNRRMDAEEITWLQAHKGIYAQEFDHKKSFRNARTAVRYICHVRAVADAPVIHKRLEAARLAGSTRVA